jgi:hypothetical protein
LVLGLREDICLPREDKLPLNQRERERERERERDPFLVTEHNPKHAPEEATHVLVSDGLFPPFSEH